MLSLSSQEVPPNRSVAIFLPESIREVLTRKSSRDPSSRFATKLHVLLSYTDENPAVKRDIGLYWTSEDEFELNKQILSKVMDLKINTLNVNLRDLKFNLIRRDKNGWSLWNRPGFTRSSTEFQLLPPTPGKVAAPGMTLGRLTNADISVFHENAKNLWADVFGVSPCDTIAVEMFVETTARKFRHAEQPLDNAKDVIKAILNPLSNLSTLSFTDFSRFLAMFGPAPSIMVKIASLLMCSNSTGRWLSFDSAGDARRQPPYAIFDDTEPNCLIMHKVNGIVKAYNHPNVAVSTAQGLYVIDEAGRRYTGWDQYFLQNPMAGGGVGTFGF
jgi:hypothetical protein